MCEVLIEGKHEKAIPLVQAYKYSKNMEKNEQRCDRDR
jgi:hypothetical protein